MARVRRSNTRRPRLQAVGPDQSALDAALGSMSDEFIGCRDFGHSWRPRSAVLLVNGGYEQTLACSRCKTIRTRILGRRGTQERNGYDYAEGYQLKGHGRMTGSDRDVLRLNSVMRLVTPAAAAKARKGATA